MLEEMKAIEENETWELVDPPPGCCPIGLKWVYKVKWDERGAIVVTPLVLRACLALRFRPKRIYRTIFSDFKILTYV